MGLALKVNSRRWSWWCYGFFQSNCTELSYTSASFRPHFLHLLPFTITNKIRQAIHLLDVCKPFDLNRTLSLKYLRLSWPSFEQPFIFFSLIYCSLKTPRGSSVIFLTKITIVLYTSRIIRTGSFNQLRSFLERLATERPTICIHWPTGFRLTRLVGCTRQKWRTTYGLGLYF